MTPDDLQAWLTKLLALLVAMQRAGVPVYYDDWWTSDGKCLMVVLPSAEMVDGMPQVRRPIREVSG